MARKLGLISLAFVLTALLAGSAYYLSRHGWLWGEQKFLHQEVRVDFEWQDGLKSARLTDPVTERELSFEELPQAIHTELLERVAALVRRAKVRRAKGRLRCGFFGYGEPLLLECGSISWPSFLSFSRPHGYELVKPDWAGCNPELLQQELDRGMDPNARVRLVLWSADIGRTLLSLACDRCDIGVVKLLLDAGADPNLADEDGSTSLMWAAYNGDVETAEMLLAAGADVNARNAYGRTALSWATKKGHEQVVELLKKHGAKE